MVPLNGSFNKWPLDYSYTMLYPIFTHTHTIFLHIARSCGILWGSPSRHPSHWSKLWGSEEKWAKEWKHLHQIFPKYLLDNLLVLFPKYLDTLDNLFFGTGTPWKNHKTSKTTKCIINHRLSRVSPFAFVAQNRICLGSCKTRCFSKTHHIYMCCSITLMFFSVQNRQLDAT